MSNDAPVRQNELPAACNALVMRTWGVGEALVVRQLLASYGIPCRVVPDVVRGMLPLSGVGLGEVRILVPAARRREATALLAEHRRQGFAVVPPRRKTAG